MVATGCINGDQWVSNRWSLAEFAKKSLLKNGVPPRTLIFAQGPDANLHRTYSTAVASRRALEQVAIRPKAVTVYTRGAHARRSRLIFQKVFGSNVDVGVISWQPPGTDSEHWWHNSNRADDFIKETAGYFWELLFDSGRRN